MTQLQLCNIRNPLCPYQDRIEADDNHCFNVQVGHPGYEVIAEDHPDHDMWLASVRGIGFDVTAKSCIIPDLPLFIPGVRRGSGKLFTNFSPEFICVALGDVLSADKLQTPKSLHKKFGVPETTKIILLAYGADRLIENLWPERIQIMGRLAELGFCAVTSVNYSVWDSHPHAERLINQKRNLLTFEDWQKFEVPAIPHIYWYSRKDIEAWAIWLNENTDVKVAAVNLQTARLKKVWRSSLNGLQYLVSQLERPIHFLVTGPSTLERIRQIQEVLPSMTLTNGYALRKAAMSHQLSITSGMINYKHIGDYDKSDLAAVNTGLYEELMKLSLTNLIQTTTVTDAIALAK